MYTHTEWESEFIRHITCKFWWINNFFVGVRREEKGNTRDQEKEIATPFKIACGLDSHSNWSGQRAWWVRCGPSMSEWQKSWLSLGATLHCCLSPLVCLRIFSPLLLFAPLPIIYNNRYFWKTRRISPLLHYFPFGSTTGDTNRDKHHLRSDKIWPLPYSIQNRVSLSTWSPSLAQNPKTKNITCIVSF